MDNWIEIRDQLPPKGVLVETKIDDENGVRNQQRLKLNAGLWYHPDGSMYVYYTPTHWRHVKK